MRKRLILINRDFQCKYIGVATMVGIVSSVLSFMTILTPLYFFQIIRFPGFLPWPFLVAIIVVAILNFALVAWASLVMTHRIAGPMFNMVKQIHLITEDKWNLSFDVRNNDDLKYLVRNFKELIQYLVSTGTRDLERLDAVDAALSESPEEAKRLLGELKDQISRRIKP